MSPPAIQALPLASFPITVSHPLIISGPCGVESESQIHGIASQLCGKGVHLLRGGIWKPRTRPDSFQGIGSEGLGWLKNAGLKNGLPVTVEVANSRHVEEALLAHIDVLWIGARTTVNPFLVQEIADALKGVDIPVMIKNPVNPDLELWIGAFERLNRTGINKLIAIHRGFSSSENSRYRNAPNWQIPIELKRRFPQLPLVCDPSHIAGTRQYIGQIAQYAMDLDYDGLMIETHTNPSEALSDREQQLTPAELQELLSFLIIRNPSVNDVVFRNLLDDLRNRIDDLDERILSLISERMGIAREIGEYKKENNMTVLQVERWNEILRTRQKSGEIKELDRDFIVRLYSLIHDESIRLQTEVFRTQAHPLGIPNTKNAGGLKIDQA
jgi:chorismate mutase